MQEHSFSQIARGSALAVLGFSDEEISALAHQGFISTERRGNGRVYYKLRYRMDGEQRVKYLGKDSEFVERVRRELASLQEDTRARRELGRLVREAKQGIRIAKARLEPLLHEAGFVFHGLSIRRPRSPVTERN